MKPVGKFVLGLLMISLSLPIPSALAGIGDLFKDVQKAVGGSGGISENEIVDGLKQALEIGTTNSVERVSEPNGYYENPKIRIPLPESVQKVKKLLVVAGYGSDVDAFELSMNQAAEQAAPKAKALFLDSVQQITFSDAQKILDGRENAATLYFEDKTRGQLFKTFEPIVHSSMSEVGVTRSYQDLNTKVQTIPFAESMNLDLDQYVTNQALNGLFLMLAEEELKIRQDPTARVTDLLKQVFGGK